MVSGSGLVRFCLEANADGLGLPSLEAETTGLFAFLRAFEYDGVIAFVDRRRQRCLSLVHAIDKNFCPGPRLNHQGTPSENNAGFDEAVGVGFHGDCTVDPKTSMGQIESVTPRRPLEGQGRFAKALAPDANHQPAGYGFDPHSAKRLFVDLSVCP